MADNGREFDVVVERDADGYYVATVPALPGCHHKHVRSTNSWSE